MSSTDFDPVRALREIYARIDREADRLTRIHAERLACRKGCSACCLDDLTVNRVEADSIRAAHAPLLETGSPHPVGACAFLDGEGACRIYAERPAVCRSQGLPLRVLFEEDDEEETISERRDICPLNEVAEEPLEKLPEEDCWLIGPFELELGRLGIDASQVDEGEEPERVALRELFRAAPCRNP